MPKRAFSYAPFQHCLPNLDDAPDMDLLTFSSRPNNAGYPLNILIRHLRPGRQAKALFE
jgi:hypothetical protein